MKNYLEKNQKTTKNKPAGQASFAGLFGCSQLRPPSPALLHPYQHSGSLWLSSPAPLEPQVQAFTLFWAMGVCRAFLDSHSPRCLWSQVPQSCTFPGQCLWSQVCLRCAHSLVGVCGLRCALTP